MKAARPIKVTVVSPAQAERAEFVICLRLGEWTPFLDNIETDCAICHQRIVHRLDAPRRPAKICLDCASVLGQTAGQVKH